MMAALTPVRDWYGALTSRERMLVAIAGVLSALTIAAYGIVLPLGAAHDAAHARHREAVFASGQVLAGLTALDDAPNAPAQSGPVAPAVAATAGGAGIVLQSAQPRGNDAAVIVVQTAAPGAVFDFLDKLAAAGIATEQATITPSADGSVAVSATLKRAVP